MHLADREEMMFLAERSVEIIKEQSTSSFGEMDLWIDTDSGTPKIHIQHMAEESSAVEFRPLVEPDSMVTRLQQGDIMRIFLAETEKGEDEVRVEFQRPPEKLIPAVFLQHPQSAYFTHGQDYVVLHTDDLSLACIMQTIRFETGVRFGLMPLEDNAHKELMKQGDDPDWLRWVSRQCVHLMIS